MVFASFASAIPGSAVQSEHPSTAWGSCLRSSLQIRPEKTTENQPLYFAMHALDGIALCLLLWGAYSGFKRGLVRELVFSLLFFWTATQGIELFQLLVPMATRKWPHFSAHLPAALAVVLFAAGGGMLLLATKLLQMLVRVSLLGVFDAALGACAGVAKVALCISFFLHASPYMGFGSLGETPRGNGAVLTHLKPLFPKLMQCLLGSKSTTNPATPPETNPDDPTPAP